MRWLLLLMILFPHFSFPQSPIGKLYFFTTPGNVIPAYLGYIEYPMGNSEVIDSHLFDQHFDMAMIDDKLLAALTSDVIGFDTANHVAVNTIPDVFARHIAAWQSKMAAVSALPQFFRVYDIQTDSLLFSLDTLKLPDMPVDLAVWDDKAFLLMQNTVVIVDLVMQDTIAAIATPHPFTGQDQNIFLVEAGDDFYIGVGYATGAIRSSLLKMSKTGYVVQTVFHHEGYAIEKPVVADDRIYFGPFDTHYSIPDDSLYITNNAMAPLPVAYDDESASPFLYHYTPNGVSYLKDGVFSDTLPIPWYVSQAMFVPAAVDTINTISRQDDRKVSVYPNPASGLVHITFPESRKIEGLQLFDITGKMIKNYGVINFKNKLTSNISYLPDGFYLIKAFTRNEMFTARIVKH